MLKVVLVKVLEAEEARWDWVGVYIGELASHNKHVPIG